MTTMQSIAPGQLQGLTQGGQQYPQMQQTPYGGIESLWSQIGGQQQGGQQLGVQQGGGQQAIGQRVSEAVFTVSSAVLSALLEHLQQDPGARQIISLQGQLPPQAHANVTIEAARRVAPAVINAIQNVCAAMQQQGGQQPFGQQAFGQQPYGQQQIPSFGQMGQQQIPSLGQVGQQQVPYWLQQLAQPRMGTGTFG